MKGINIWFLILLFGSSGALAETILPLTQEDQFSVIEINIGNQKLRAILDTGSNVNVMDPKWELLLQLSEQKQKVRTSDQKVQQYRKGTAAIELDGKKQVHDFVLSSTGVSKKCCDLILGKPFFDRTSLIVNRTDSQVQISPDPKLVKKNLYEFKIAQTQKEIVIECRLEKEKVLGRLDMGSQQAVDISGPFADKIKARKFEGIVFLDTLLQTGFALAKVDVACGNWNFGKDVPSVLQPLSQTALGQGSIAFNVGAPLLNMFDIYFDLPHEKIIFWRKSPEPLMFNTLLVFLGQSVVSPQDIFVKSVLRGGLGDELGLRPGDQVKKIQGKELKDLSSGYRMIEDTRNRSYDVEIMRNGETKKLKASSQSLFPKKEIFPQTFYGIDAVPDFKNPISRAQAPPPQEIQTIRMVLKQVWADFSLASFMEGVSIRNLLLKPFFVKQVLQKDNLFFEGVSLNKKGQLSGDSGKTVASLGISNCKKVQSKFDSFFYNELVMDFRHQMVGCGSTIELSGTFYYFKKQGSTDLKLADIDKNLFYLLRDQNSLVAYRWPSGKVQLTVDAKSPEWVEKEVRAAVTEYNKVLMPKLELEVTRGDLDIAKIANPEIHGIYWSNEGHAFDAETRFGATSIIGKPETGEVFDADLILRANEFLQYENFLQTMILEKFSEGGKISEAKAAEFKKWKDEKINKMRKNVVLHEMGHVLGLAHNFSKKEDSIMNYSDRQTLAEYDKSALRFLYYDESPKRVFELVDVVATNPSSTD